MLKSVVVGALCHGVASRKFIDPNSTIPLGPLVSTESGLVQGLTRIFGLTHNVDQFMGIPFAAPPTGENRLKPPQPYADSWWPWIRQADVAGSLCPQLDIAGDLHLGEEDCLYLNVYRPTGSSSTSNLPVYFWIYGGAYVLGDGYEFTLYDGANLVNQHGYVVVTMNYRLNGLGFFALPELAAENSDGTTGNYAMQDQQAAMRWVQRNIQNFGGDPSRVTIGGESAGAFSVHYHLVAPASRGLFHAAIAQSGTSHLDFVFQDLDEAFEFYDGLANGMGCPSGNDRLKCLRSLSSGEYIQSVKQIVTIIWDKLKGLPLPQNVPFLASPLFPVMPFGPVIDKSYAGLPDVPLDMIRRGDFAQVPLMLGSNKDGGAYFGPILPILWGDNPIFKFDVASFSKWFFSRPADQAEFVRLYGGEEFSHDQSVKNMSRFQRAFRDMLFTCSNREVALLWNKANLPTYFYMFSFDFGGLIGASIGDAHAIELPFQWRNWVDVLGALTDLDIFGKKYGRMSDIFSSSWASFVECQSPRCDAPPRNTEILNDLPKWPRFDADRKFYSLQLDPVVESMSSATYYPNDEFPGDNRCDFWANAKIDLVKWKKNRNAFFLQKSETVFV